MKTISELLAAINAKISTRAKFEENFPGFIFKIRFPVFKSLEENAAINFKHPFTVFVGQNGCGKSSALQALSGAPYGQSVGNFWFSTVLDPIKEGKGRPNCFIYEYYNVEAKKRVEIIKTRVQFNKQGGKNKNLDNWEPKRGDKRYGMVLPVVKNGKPEPGAEKTIRWKVPRINTVYLDFRSELSAFDQYFYFGERPENLVRYSSKQDRLRAWTKNKLAPLFKGIKEYITDRAGVRKNRKAVELNADTVELISYILGKDYLRCKMVEHKIFGLAGWSVLFEVPSKQYTEAFAGSGEMAVVRVVNSVLSAKENSLILLDEPEVSLHPGAQKRLRDFLLDQCAERGHQIVLCTHSPVFLEQLPKECIKVFVPNSDGTFRIVEDVSRSDAFVSIGHTIESRKQIHVEDQAAKQLVEFALKRLGPEFVDGFQVIFAPGGETAIFKDFVVYARNDDSGRYVLFDGDCDAGEWPEVDAVSNNQLDEVIKQYTGQDAGKIGFRFDGGNNPGNLVIKREFLKYMKERCFYLPTEIPEEIIWAGATFDKTQYELGVDPDKKDRFKDYIGNYATQKLDSDTSVYRSAMIQAILKNEFDEQSPLFKKLLVILRRIKNSHPS